MKTVYLMLIATVMFAACNIACAADASYEDCIGDYAASWEGPECDWIREQHPAYIIDEEEDE